MDRTFWLGIVVSSSDKKRLPALAVKLFEQGRYRTLRDDGAFPRLWVFGYDMDNMKARAWVEKTIPLIYDFEHAEDFDFAVEALILTANYTARNTVSACKAALFRNPKEARGDTSHIEEACWRASANYFHEIVRDLAAGKSTQASLKEPWLKRLFSVTLKVFDDELATRPLGTVDPWQIAKARKDLALFNRPGGKKIQKIWNLEA